MEDEYVPGVGAVPDRVDQRDFDYRPVLAAAPVDVNWPEGFDAFKFLNLGPIVQDQDGSSSCVGQAVKQYTRRWLFHLLGIDAEQSARWVYQPIRIAGGGAEIRQGVLRPATVGMASEAQIPSYDSGNPPGEVFMSQMDVTPELEAAAKKMDQFSARVILGVEDPDTFAHAILVNLGVVGGFVGTNQGWTRSVVRPPKPGETRWGHCVDLCAFGELDVEQVCGEDVYPVGTKCLFTLNSWGGRYVIQTGKWAGYQAIPVSYLTTGDPQVIDPVTNQPAVGAFVFNPWVLVPDAILPPEVINADLLKRLEGKLVLRAEAQGQVYEVKKGKLTFLDSVKQPDGHTPVYDNMVKRLSAAGQLTGLSEANYRAIGGV